jgi:ubiquinone/menaquinone biosynthesis C-methylase UbiE
MFPFKTHLRMLADNLRVEAYRRAIFQTVRKGDRVADIGTGTGMLAFFALQAGARKVYAIDSDPIIEVAKKTARENGLFDRMDFIHQDSLETDIPAKVDVVVTETCGCLGVDEGIEKTLSDARKRFLKKEGHIIPAQLSLLAVPVCLPTHHPFQFLEEDYYGIQTKHIRELAVNNVYGLKPASAKDVRWLSGARKLIKVDFYTCEPLPWPLTMKASFQILREGIFNGVVVFPVTILAKDLPLSLTRNSRFLDTHWEIPFFPVTPSKKLSQNDSLEFQLTMTQKNGFVWQFFIEQNGSKQALTQLSTFGLPSLEPLFKNEVIDKSKA